MEKAQSHRGCQSPCGQQGPRRASCSPVESSGRWLVPARRDFLSERTREQMKEGDCTCLCSPPISPEIFHSRTGRGGVLERPAAGARGPRVNPLSSPSVLVPEPQRSSRREELPQARLPGTQAKVSSDKGEVEIVSHPAPKLALLGQALASDCPPLTAASLPTSPRFSGRPSFPMRAPLLLGNPRLPSCPS